MATANLTATPRTDTGKGAARSLRRDGDRFVLTTPREEISAKRVILATAESTPTARHILATGRARSPSR